MEVGRAADEDGDELAGASERQPKRSGVWNKYDDAAAAGIFAAARAAGATGAGIKYGEVNYKIWFRPQGDEPKEVADKIKALQLATANARLEELERRNAGMSARAQKEKQRKLRQKAAKKAAKEQQQQPSAQQRSKADGQATAGWHTAQQQPGETDRDDPMMAVDERAAALSAAYVIAAASQHPGDVRVQRVAKLRDKQWQLTVLQGTRAAGMNELQLGKALSKACDEQQRERMLQQLMQQVPGPLAASAAPGGAAKFRFGVHTGSTPSEKQGFELFQ